MDFLTDLGIGLAIGMLAGTTGTQGGARGRMTLLAAVIGLVVGILVDGGLGAALGFVGAVVGCVVSSDLVAGASRREGSAAAGLAFIVGLAALIVIAISLVFSPLVILVILALLWLGVSRHRRAQRKHAGLRVLR